MHHLIAALSHLGIEALDGIFLVGLAGAAIVLLMTSIEDVKTIFSK